jgi:uncharacterized protein (TIGR00730 family)
MSIVSVFGASSSQPGEDDYEDVVTLGRLLAEAGHTVMTGGYGGMMEAASKGAKLAGGRVIGVTVSLFEGPGRRPGPNAHIDEVIRYDRLRDRLFHLVDHCDAAVAVGGGIGTLSEFALAWSFVQVGEIEPIPLILMGKQWHSLINQFYGDGRYIRDEHMQLWKGADTPQQVVEMIRDWGIP